MKKQIGIALAVTGGLLVLGACSKHESPPQKTMTPASASAMKIAPATKMAPATAAKAASQSGSMGTAPPPATVPPPRTGG